MPSQVEIAKDGLAARCSMCRKTIMYRRSMHLQMWKQLVKVFVRKHEDCKPN